MDYRVKPGSRTGEVTIPASKSYAHRLLISFALSDKGGCIECEGMSKDILATAKCLQALGAEIEIKENKYLNVKPISTVALRRDLYCGESGSTLRFLVPVVGALGARAVFHMEGKLPKRPMSALTDELCRHGMKIWQEGDLLYCEGRIKPGRYTIPGNISSQYISGLLFALPILGGQTDDVCTINITDGIESTGYIAMTEDVIQRMGINFTKEDICDDSAEQNTQIPIRQVYKIPTGQIYKSTGDAEVEKDWSNAAFFACIGALSTKGLTLKKMPIDSRQGDRKIIEILRNFGTEITEADGDITVRRGRPKAQTIDVSEVPDLVPTMSVVAACCPGTTRIINAERLRIKESDRLQSTAAMLTSLGADVEELQDALVVRGKADIVTGLAAFTGGEVDSVNDHRIAMAAAVAATCSSGEVLVKGAECVSKSYPRFWEDYEKLEME